jgi:hypothetical protein
VENLLKIAEDDVSIDGTLSDVSNEQYRTNSNIGTSNIGPKMTESGIMSDIGLNF